MIMSVILVTQSNERFSLMMHMHIGFACKQDSLSGNFGITQEKGLSSLASSGLPDGMGLPA